MKPLMWFKLCRYHGTVLISVKNKPKPAPIIEFHSCSFSINMQKFQTIRMLPFQLPGEHQPWTHRLSRTVDLQTPGPRIQPKPHAGSVRAGQALPRHQQTRIQAPWTPGWNPKGVGPFRHATSGPKMVTTTQHQPRTCSNVPNLRNGPRSGTHSQQRWTQGLYYTENGEATKEDSPKH